jgi:putative toxin-antitoxin system antitoxin component (TIGR02293 family)
LLASLAPQTVSRSVALKALSRIAERWQLRRQDLSGLLGRVPGRTLRDWYERDRGQLSPDAIERISHIVAIYDGLHRLFGDSDYADRWIHNPNDAFGGSKPVELLLSGSFTALVNVRQYIDRALAV